MRSISILTAIAAATVASSALAAAISGPFTVTMPAYEALDWATGAGTQKVLNMPKFNGALGTLTKVDIREDMDINSILTVTNHNATAVDSGTIASKVKMTVASTDVNKQVTFYSDDFDFSGLAAGDHVTSGEVPGSGSNTNSFSAPTTLAHFVGAGTYYPLTFTTTSNFSYSGPGNVDYSQTVMGEVSGTVTYTYTAAPLPEPAVIGLLASAVPALMIRRREKKLRM